MSKFLLSFGLAITIGSGAAVYDHSAQSAKTPGEVLDLMQYMASVQGRVVNLMEPAPRARIASLPQTDRKMSTASFSAAPRSTQGDIDDFVKDSPQLQAMIKVDREMQKESFWARIRHKVTGSDDSQSGNRLAAIRKRNTAPKHVPGIDPSELANMSTAEILANQQGMQQHVKNMLSQGAQDF